MSLFALPTEIIVEIAKHVTTKQDILSLLTTNSVFLRICRPRLYHGMAFDINRVLVSALKWSRTITTSPELASYVRVLTIGGVYPNGGGRMVKGASYRLLAQALSRLKNLRLLRIYSVPHEFWCILLGPIIQFPLLEFMNSHGTPHEFQFLARHKTIRGLMFRDDWLASDSSGVGSSQATRDKRSIYSLVSYTGRLDLLLEVASTARLEQIRTAGILSDTNTLLQALTIYGPSLKSLDIHVKPWPSGLFGRLAELAPFLEHFAFSGAECDEVLSDLLQLNRTIPCLKSLTFYDDIRTISQWSEVLQRLPPVCPSLFLFSSNTLTKKAERVWRFNSVKQVWIPPVFEKRWWTTVAVESGITTNDYYSVQVRPSDLDAPLAFVA